MAAPSQVQIPGKSTEDRSTEPRRSGSSCHPTVAELLLVLLYCMIDNRVSGRHTGTSIIQLQVLLEDVLKQCYSYSDDDIHVVRIAKP